MTLMLRIVPLCMYFLSFIPLWIAVVFLDIQSIMSNNKHIMTEIVSIVLIALGTIISWRILGKSFRKAKEKKNNEYRLTQAREMKSVTAEYTLTYVIPLFAFDFTKWDKTVLFLIFFIILGFICYRHNYFILNVFLDLKKYRIFECVYVDTEGNAINGVVISKQRLNSKVGYSLRLYNMNNDYYIDQYEISVEEEHES